MVRHLLGTAAAVALLTGPVFAQDATEEAAETGEMTVQQCAPVVTVTQTPPQVTVTIPEDDGAEPVVTVAQTAPEVTVESCAPTITGPDGEEMQAEFTEAEADVTINAAETAELTVTRMGAAESDKATADEPSAAEATAEEPAAEEPAEADSKDQMGEAPEGEDAVTEAEPAPEAEIEPASDDMAVPMADAEDGAEAEPATDAETMPTEAMPESDPQAPEVEASDEAAADAAATDVAPSSGEVTASANAIALREGRSLVEADEIMADGMDGTPVFSSDDEEVGEITMFDTESEAAIVGVGGFLGLGEKNVALPLADLSFQKDKDGELRAYIATASDQIEALPEHETSE